MSLIVALQGRDELVFASDTLGWDAMKEGYYKFQVSKLRVLSRNWILGSAGTGIGADLQEQIEASTESFGSDIDLGARAYARRTAELYRRCRYVGETSFLLGGFNRQGPVLYRWSFPEFSGAVRCRAGRAAIGIGEHGAMYFAAAYHTESMTTETRMLLAHFCIHEVTRRDPQVGTPIELAVARHDGVRTCSPNELASLHRESEALTTYISTRFSSPGMPRAPLLERELAPSE